MSSKSKSSLKRSGISPEIMEAAQAIAKIKGENLNELEAKFFNDYVYENLHILTEKARTSLRTESEDANA